MKIAYLILAHKSPQQLARLVHALETPSARFFLHWDAKSGPPGDTLRGLASRPGVHLVGPSVRVYWGDFSHIRATLLLLREAVNHSERFDYFFLISGQDYPIRSNESIQTLLAAAEGRSFVYHWKLGPTQIDRIRRWHFCISGRWLRLPPLRSQTRFIARRFPEAIEPFVGYQWWCLHRSAVDEILTAFERDWKVIKWYRWSLCPDEMVFQTILANSSLRDRMVNRPLTYADFETGPEHPRVIRLEDVKKLAEVDAVFARKFDDPSGKLLDVIDRDFRSR